MGHFLFTTGLNFTRSEGCLYRLEEIIYDNVEGLGPDSCYQSLCTCKEVKFFHEKWQIPLYFAHFPWLFHFNGCFREFLEKRSNSVNTAAFPRSRRIAMSVCYPSTCISTNCFIVRCSIISSKLLKSNLMAQRLFWQFRVFCQSCPWVTGLHKQDSQQATFTFVGTCFKQQKSVSVPVVLQCMNRHNEYV